MSMRQEINENMLEMVSGGSVTYTPDSLGAATGTIGIDGNEKYRYKNEEDVFNWISAHYKDKAWKSVAERDNYVIQGLLSAGLIQ